MMTVTLHHDVPKTEVEDVDVDEDSIGDELRNAGSNGRNCSPNNDTCYSSSHRSRSSKCADIKDLFETLNKELDASHNSRSDVNQNKSPEQEEEDKSRRLLHFDEAPEYLAHNRFILSGYRGLLSTKLCLESVFWWTNETINIWSHIFGFCLFTGLTVHDIFALHVDATWTDKVIVAQVLVCFMICMLLSSLYHTFSCRSESDFHCFLSFDLFGIALSLLAIYISGIYFAFWCHPGLRHFYISTVSIIFGIAMALQLPRFQVDSNVKMLVFVAWAAYGVVPTVHWTYIMGGFNHPVVNLLLPRVMGMYGISGTAFFIYITKIPERFAAGKFDFLGHSHQWWHIIIVMALYYWHCSGIVYVNYRINHACVDSMSIDFYTQPPNV